MRRWLIPLVLASLVAPRLCMADALQEGRDLYKAGKFAEAVTKLEQATREDPNNPKAWWQLNFAYNKLERFPDALRAAETAGKLDPSYGFASAPGKYEETVTRLRKKAGGGPSDRQSRPLIEGSSRQAGGDASMSRQLQDRGVYVQSGMSVDADRLAALVREFEPVQVRFLVFNSRAGSAALSREADRVRKYLGIKDGYVIACSKAGVAASSTSLNRDTLRDLTRQVALQMENGDYTGGLERLARGLTATKRSQVKGRNMTWIILLGGVGGVGVLWVISRRMRNSRAMRARRTEIDHAREEIVAQMNYLDDAAGTAAPAVVGAVRQARLEAGEKLDEASRLIVRARSEYDLTRAQSMLQEARASIARGRAVLDGGAVGAASTPGLAPPVYATSQLASGRETAWDEVDEADKGVCFFCSKPSLISELSPVTVMIEGEQRKVLACADDYATARTGQVPSIRAFNRDGRYVPWYAESDYNPYRDYYDRGYDSRSMMSDMITLSMIDHMFWSWHRPTWGWGGGYGSDWGGYTFYADHDRYRDYQVERAAASSDIDQRDAAGTDFLGASSDFGSDRDTAGVDFLGGDRS